MTMPARLERKSPTRTVPANGAIASVISRTLVETPENVGNERNHICLPLKECRAMRAYHLLSARTRPEEIAERGDKKSTVSLPALCSFPQPVVIHRFYFETDEVAL